MAQYRTGYHMSNLEEMRICCECEGWGWADSDTVQHRLGCSVGLRLDQKEFRRRYRADAIALERVATLASEMSDREYIGLLQRAMSLWRRARNEVLTNRILKMVMTLPEHDFASGSPSHFHTTRRCAESDLMLSLGGHERDHFIRKYRLWHLAVCRKCGRPAACSGNYDVRHSLDYQQFACNECCGHSNRGGSCRRIPSRKRAV